MLDDAATGDVLRVTDQFLGDLIDPIFGTNFAADTGVASIVFADGVIWDEFQIALAVSHPLDSDDPPTNRTIMVSEANNMGGPLRYDTTMQRVVVRAAAHKSTIDGSDIGAWHGKTSIQRGILTHLAKCSGRLYDVQFFI